jgi:hypothetical protein
MILSDGLIFTMKIETKGVDVSTPATQQKDLEGAEYVVKYCNIESAVKKEINDIVEIDITKTKGKENRETVEYIQYIKDALIVAKKSVVKKIDEKIMNEIEAKVEKQDLGKISYIKLPVIEPVYIREHIEPLGANQDVQASKAAVQNLVEKLETIESIEDVNNYIFDNKTVNKIVKKVK